MLPPITADVMPFTKAAARASSGILAITFLRAAGFQQVDAMLARNPYIDLFTEGARTFKDDDGRSCLVYNAYLCQPLQDMLDIWQDAVGYDLEKYKGPAFPQGDDDVVVKNLRCEQAQNQCSQAIGLYCEAHLHLSSI